MYSKLPPLVQETLVMGAGAGLSVLASNPTPDNWHDGKHLLFMVVGAIIAAEVKAWRTVAANWLANNPNTLIDNSKVVVPVIGQGKDATGQGN